MPFSKALFTNQQARELHLVDLLKEQKFCDYKSICNQLDCSFLTLQSEISNLENFTEVKDVTYVSSHLDISYHDPYGPKKFYQSILLEAPSLKLLELLLFSAYDSMEELAEELFISLSTLKRLLKKTGQYLKEHFNLFIDLRTLDFKGDEKNIRLLFLKYFSEAYDYHHWPFEGYLDEEWVNNLINTITLKGNVEIDFSLFSHLKLLVGINLLRYSKGNKVGTIYSNSKKLAKLLSRDKEGQRLNQEFENHYSLSLDSLTLSELFSNYLKEGLIFRQNHQYELLLLRAKTRKLTLRHWERNFRQLESKTNIPLTKKPDVACKLHNAIILQEEDYHLNFLVYDYRQDFLGYFKKDFPLFYKDVTETIQDLLPRDVEQSDRLIENLTYILLITWDNLFTHLSTIIAKQRVLVVEKGSCNVGQFLEAFASKFYDITVFKEADLKAVDIAQNFDIVLTDTTLEVVDGVAIYFFDHLVPTLALNRLHQHLKESLQKQIIENASV